MSLTELLVQLLELNVHLYVEEDRLKYDAPKNVLTDELKAQLKANKQELIESLTHVKKVNRTSIHTSPRTGAIPLSYAQQRLWFLDQLEPGSSFYNIPMALRLEGPLNQLALEQGINEIIRRHENLRTTFVSVDGEAAQVIADSAITPVACVDLSAFPEQTWQTLTQQVTQEEATTPFDLAKGPLMRVRLIHLSRKQAKHEAILLVTLHHIISDGWSNNVLTREFVTLYQAYSEGNTSPLSELTIQYSDYAYWQRQWLDGAILQQQIDYWRRKLSNIPALLELPTIHPRPTVMGYDGAIFHSAIPPALSEQLHDLSRHHNVTLFVTMLTAFSILLSRHSQQTDICIGTPIANRQRLEIEELIGFFVNTLVLRVDLSDSPSFNTLLTQVNKTVLEAQSHQDLPFEQLVTILAPERSMGHSPLFQVMFTLQNSVTRQIESIQGMTIGGVESEGTTAKFDLSLHINQEETGILTCSFEYNTDLFELETITRLADHYLNLLQGVIEQPQRQVSQLPLLTESEAHQLLVGFNATVAEYPQHRCIHELFEHCVEQNPEAIAVVFKNFSLTYSELNLKANQLAHHLRNEGVRPDSLVGLCMEKSIATVIGVIGTLKAGGAYLPLDPDLPEERLNHMIAESQAAIVLTQGAVFSALPAGVICVDINLQWDEISAQETENIVSQAHPDNLAYVIYTSGSTNRPKGVMISHSSLTNAYFAWRDAYQLGSKVRSHLQMANFSFDVFAGDIVRGLLSGDKLVICPRSILLEAPLLYDLMCRERVNIAEFVPAVLRNLMLYLEKEHKKLACMELLICGSDTWTREEYQKCRRFFAETTRIINSYGLTEVTIDSTYYEEDSSEISPGVLPIGRPFANTKTYLMDKELNNVPIGVIGELYIGGAGLARGYLNHPESTAEKYIPNPFSEKPGERLYKTGDTGRYLSNGEIEFLGRNDFQVKIRGFRIELGEVEAQLAKCPGVREAVVMAREDVPGDKRLVAYLVAEAGQEPEAAELRGQLSAVLADYMVPSAYVTLSELPLTPNGKLDRKALPAPDGSAVISRTYEAPHGLTEILVAQVWRELLQLEQVGRHDHFFELGGHSLMVVTLIERLRLHGLSATVRTVFASPVLADMAVVITEQSKSGKNINIPSNPIPDDCTALTPDLLPLVSLGQEEIDRLIGQVPGGVGNIQDIYPLAPLQEGILFHHLLEQEGDAYLLRSVLSFDTKERLDSFLNALQTVINRHDILRTAIHWTGLPQPVQVVQRQAPLAVTKLDTTNGQDIQAWLLDQTDPRRMRVDLSCAPLFAIYLAYDGRRNEWLMALLNHHIICDHLTLELIIAEIQQILEDQTASLSKPLPYRNFIAQALAISPAEHEAYFKAQLGDITEPTTPFGILDVQGDGSRIVEATLPLSDSLAHRIRTSARQHGVTAAVLFHAAWGHVLSQCTGRDQVVFGTVLLGRLQGSEGADRVLGMFINTLPVRVDLGNHSAQAIIQATYRRLSDLLEHEQASLTLAQRCSAVDASLPLFTTLLNYRHSAPPHDNADGQTVTAFVERGQQAWEGMHIHHSEERTNYPITVSVDDLGQGFSLTAQCMAGIGPERITNYLNTAITQLVDALSQTPKIPVSQLSILPEPERHQLLVGFNATVAEYPQHRCIHELFEGQANKQPTATALVYEGQSLSYGGLNRCANRLAHRLIELGIRPDDRVAICAERSLEMVIGLLGILKAGGAYVPLDPGYPEERLAYMLSDSAPVAVLTQSGLQARLPGLSASLDAGAIPVILLDGEGQEARPMGEVSGVADLAGLCLGYPEHNPEPARLGLTSRHLAYVIYTSGFTGQPKGVMVSHANVGRLFAATQAQYRFTADDTWALFHSFAFDFSVWEVWGPLFYGGRLIIIPHHTSRNPEAFYQLLAQERVTVLNQTPSAFRQLIAVQADNPIPHNLRCIIFGGEALEFHSLKPWIERNSLNDTRLINMYGITEITVHATYRSLTEEDIQAGQASNVGKPLDDLQFYILDSHLQPVPIGVAGEIYIGGAGVARGYLNRADLTAERFIADPFGQGQDNLAGAADNGRLYKTGDLGRWLPDGSVEYLGRNDFQVKIRGFRIELGEVEAQLAKCPGVREAVVMAREDVPGDKRLVAYLVAEAGQEPEAAELRGQLSAVLADYMVPSAYVTLSELPLTPNGKLDRKALPAPDGSSAVSRAYEVPQGPTETLVAQIWQELLRLEQVGRHDHFFELGGHSLLAVQLVSRLRLELGIEVPLRDLFAQPVLADFAKTVTNARQAELPPVQVADRSQPIPLSWAQQRLWFLDQLDPAAGVAYHMPAGLRLQGRLNKAALKASLDRIVARHEVLRTRFVSQDGQTFQHIAPAHGGFALAEQDLAALSKRKQRTAVEKIAADEASHPFGLDTGPLIRGQLLELGEDEHILLITQHHIVSDGWSIGLLVREFGALYTAFSQGQEDPLPELCIQYADYAAWQRQWLQGGTLQAQVEFWEHHLTGAPALLELPTDRPRPAVQSYAGGSVGFELAAELSAGLKQLAQGQGCTLFMVLLAGWSVLMARLSGQADLVIGTPVANRQRTEVEPLIGFFVNTLALRVRLDGNPTIRELLKQVKATTLDAYGHQDIPFEQVVDLIKPERSMGHNPVFQVMLAMDNSPDAGELPLPGLSLSGLELAHTTTQFDLSLSLADSGANIVGSLEYASELFGKATIGRFIGYYQALLAGMAADTQQRIGQLPFLPEPERHQLLVGFNATVAEYPQHRCIHELFEGQANQQPTATALVYEGQSLSYGGLNRCANRLAHRLIELGIRPDDRVAICAERSLEMVIGLLGILKAGGAYVPLDPGYPEERLAYMLSDSAPVAVLTQSGLQARLPGLSASLDAGAIPVILLDGEGQEARPMGEVSGVADLAGLCLGYPEHNPEPARLGLTSRHLAYVIYTSGSTGQPKGVMVSHANVGRLFAATQAQYRFTADDTWALFHSFAFDFSVWEVWGPLFYGGRLIIIPHHTSRNPEAFYQLLAQERVTVLNQTPSAFRQLIAVQADNPIPHNLRCIIFGGEALEFHSLKPWIERNSLNDTRLINMYGITEITVHATYRSLTEEDIQAGQASNVGKPLDDLQFYILDSHLQPVPIGVAGEIYIGGAGVARGYLNRADLTAERFIADPFGQGQDNLAGAADNGRLYKTGDLGRWLPDGSVEYLGRNDFQVKIRGFRIELGEVEAQLAKCPGVREAVVMAREDVPGDKRLVAYLVAEAGQEPEAAELRGQLSAVLADYMVPSAYVTLSELPLTPNGKLDRKALPAPDGSSAVSRAYEVPQGPTETLVAQIWQELLRLEQVGRHDHFFELGGHSLLAVQLVSRLRLELGIEVPLRDLFAQPVLADFAKTVTNARQAELPPVQVADRSQPIPLSWAQQRLWFLDQLDPAAGVAYHMPAGLRLQGRLNKAALKASLDRIVARHEVLRTRFVSQDGQTFQHIAPAHGGFALAEQDLAALSKRKQRTAVEKIAADEASHPFGLDTGPLIRGQLLELGEDEHILLITQHHIVSDGWSIGLLVREFGALYTAFSQGQEDPLPELCIQYADYAAWQRQWLQGGTLQAQVEFWEHHLTGAPALLELPTDRPRPAVQSYAGGSVGFELAAELSAGLKQLAQGQGCTLFMVLLAGWSVLMARLSGQADLVIGTPVANRQRTEVEPLIGFFVNTLALRVRLDGNPTIRELLKQVKATTLDAYGHQDIPFEQVVDLIKPERSMGHNPVFQVMLAMDNSPDAGELPLPGLSLSGLELAHTTTQFDLSLSLADSGANIVGSLEYASELFGKATIGRFIGYYQALLAGMAADTQQRIGQLPFLPEPERHQLLVGFNATVAEYPQHRCIHELFEGQANQQPTATALVYEGQSLSYGGLNRCANRLAHRLIELGIRPDDRVAICAERSLEMVIGLLGILKAGGAYVPLDPGYPEERLAYMLSDSAPVAVLTQSGLQARLPGLSASLDAGAIPVILLDGEGQEARPMGEVSGVADLAGLCLGYPEHNPEPARLGLTSRHLAYVIYTSGSTGQPKGVMNQHQSVVNRLWWAQNEYQLVIDDRILQKTPFSFDVSVWEFFLPLLTGAQLVIAKPQGHQDPEYLSATIIASQITTVHFVPSMLQIFLEQADIQPCSSSLRRVLCSGEALPYTLQMRFHNLLPTVELHNLYGPTEAAVDVTSWLCSPEHGIKIVPIGCPIANTQIYILDSHLQPVPIGVAGEIYIGGAGVARGYLNRADLTAERFIADPFGQGQDNLAGAADNGRLYKTGDLGRWLPDGSVEYLGRNDFQVKIRGFRIELGEVEAQLAKCPGVREAVVMAREDVPGDKRLVAYLVAEAGQEPEAAELRGQLSAVLADYMVPSAYVTLSELPLTPNGKLDRKALPAPDGSALMMQTYIPPRNYDEEILATIWASILGVEKVGIDDGFFVLGGDSIRTIQILNLAKKRGIIFSLAQLYQHSTIRELLAVINNNITIDNELKDPFSLISDNDREKLPANLEDAYPLTALQSGMIFHSELDRNAYHIFDSILLRGRLDMPAFEYVISKIFEKHPILRTSFDMGNYSEPLQLVFPSNSISTKVDFDDWSKFNEDQQYLKINRWRDNEKTNVFDISKAPLIRFHIHKFNDHIFHLGMSSHHAILDGWSVISLLNELFTYYLYFMGENLDLNIVKPFNAMRELVIWEKKALETNENKHYWHKNISSMVRSFLPEMRNITDNIKSNNPEGIIERRVLSLQLSRDLQNIAKSLRVPLRTVLLTAHFKVLSILYGNLNVTTGLVTSVRPEVADADRSLGLFLNTLPLIVTLKEGSWNNLILYIFGAERGLIEHRFYPLAEIQRKYGSQLFDSMFTYVHNHIAKEMTKSDEFEIIESEVYLQSIVALSTGVDLDVVSDVIAFEIKGDCYNFNESQIIKIADYLLNILSDIVENPTCFHNRSNFLTEPERHQLLVGFNATVAEYPQHRCIHELFEGQANKQPTATALVYEGQSLSYGGLNRCANRLAHRLIELGIRPDDRVAICAERSLEMVIGLLGILKAGGAYVPLDPGYPEERLAYMLSDSAPVAVLTQSGLQARLPGLSASLDAGAIPVILLDGEGQEARPMGEVSGVADLAGLCLGYPEHNPEPARLGLTSRHLAYVIYTSGSTGQPKGVMVEHRSVLRLVINSGYAPITPNDCVAHCASPVFDASTWEIWAPLLNGARLLLVPQQILLNPPQFNQELIKANVTALWLTVGLFNKYIDDLKETFSHLKYLLVGGDVLDPKIIKTLLKSSNAPAKIINGYGPTETTTFASTHNILAIINDNISIPIGRPIANTQIYILDSHLQPVPIGVAGEIYIGGAGVARGYLNRADLTAERFIADPFGQGQDNLAGAADNGRLYKTGDLGRWLPDGSVEYLGRNDFQVKIRGFRIELGEVEAQLAKCPGVREAVVMAREDVPGDKRLVAYLVAEAGQEPEAAELRGQLSAVLADYMVPSAYVTLSELPLTPNGKLDRKALPAPNISEQLGKQYVAPRTSTEKSLTEIWSQLLNIEKVGINNSFIELGGHSLIATQLITRVNMKFNIKLPLKILFEVDSIEKMSEKVDIAQWISNQKNNIAIEGDMDYEDIEL